MGAWIRRWQLPEMFAGVAEVGAEDVWWEMSLDLEELQMRGIPFAGAGVDVFKCFDQIIRDLVYRLAGTAGMPSKVLDTYRRYQEGLTTMNAVAGGLWEPYKRFMGIPQGCPMRMMVIMLLLRACIVEMRATDVKPRDLADDLLMVASGEQHCTQIIDAVEKAYEYMHGMGAKVATQKSITFSSSPTQDAH